MTVQKTFVFSEDKLVAERERLALLDKNFARRMREIKEMEDEE